MENQYAELLESIQYQFKNLELLENAFVHRSYLNENKDKHKKSNERLEFLGDAVLELIVTEYLFLNYSNPEGELTNWRSALVKGETLAKVSKKLNLGKYLFLSKGEENSGGREKDYLLANAFEALVGAIYLDSGYTESQKFVETFLLIKLKEILKKGSYIDSKSKFQEVSQEKTGVTPSYRLLKDEGPDHNKTFTMGAYIDEKMVGKGTGSSKQSAEQKAARDALERLNWK